MASDPTSTEGVPEGLLAVLRATPEPHFVLAPTGTFVELNGPAEELTGYSRQELLGRSFLDLELLAPEEATVASRGLERSAESGNPRDKEYTLVRRDGARVPVLVRAYPLEASGNTFVVGVVRDISRRREAEQSLEVYKDHLEKLVEERTAELSAANEQLRSSEERLRVIFEYAPDAFYLNDTRGELVDGNRAAAALCGYDKEELIGRNFATILAPDQIPVAMKLLEENLEGRGTGPDELVLLRKDGSRVAVEVHTFPTTLRGEQVVLGIARDISERRAAEEDRSRLEGQLRQSQKMEAIGLLAGGVAHDMNNILGTVMGLATLGRARTGPEDPLGGEDFADIMRACRRGRELTLNLLGFARKGKRRTAPFEPNVVVSEVAAMLARTIPKTISIDKRLGDALDSVVGDTSQMTQALMNVCINAQDAMEGHGTLRLSTDRRHFAEPHVAEPSGLSIPAGDYVAIEVEDTGAGIPPEALERIFEPFFTTKGRGEGTGLGLAMVYGAVRDHGGAVDIDSRPGMGTRVALLLPASHEEAIQRRSGTFKAATEVPAGTTVLLVEDDAQLRKAMERQVRMLGCDVLLATNGVEAFRVYREERERIDMVLLDLVMPEMDGEQAFHAIRHIDPGARVVVVSGFSRDGAAQALLDEGAIGFLQKPVELHELAAALLDALRDC